MRVHFENILLNTNESFRLLRWQESSRDIQVIHANGEVQSMTGAGETWHLHPQVELAFIKQGSGTWFIGDYIGAFDAPLLVLIGPNLPHCWRSVRASEGYVLQFAFGSDHGIWKLPEMEPLREICVLASRGVSFPESVVSIVSERIIKMLSCSPIQRLAYFLEILAILLEIPASECSLLSQKEFSLSSTSIHHKAIDRVIRYTIERHAEEISLDEMLKVAHMSKPTFSRQFKRHTGKTFIDFLNEVRLDQVRRALLETEESISRIALQSGFGNLSHFNRLFRRHFGLSPSEFRKKRA